jgi:GTP-binding protein
MTKITSIPKITEVGFLTGARSFKYIPETGLPEIAVAGRSNVGKSSLLRIVLGNKKLVRVSSRPGRTREINFFKIATKELPPFIFSDLPGYGYASVSISLRKEWGAFISEYLEKREYLSMVILLVDARRTVKSEETDFVQWLNEQNLPWCVVITKIDKLPKTKWETISQKVKTAFNMKKKPLIFSAPKRIGIEPLWNEISKNVNLWDQNNG